MGVESAWKVRGKCLESSGVRAWKVRGYERGKCAECWRVEGGIIEIDRLS